MEDGLVKCGVPDIDQVERHGFLFGYPIAHSMSPLLHQTIYDDIGLNWRQFPLPSTDMQHFLQLVRDPRFYGASVTMPHKVSIGQFLDDITPEGKAVGACNTIFRRGTQLVGTNTDTIGIRESFLQNVKDPTIYHGRPGMVIGGGGAARSAAYALVQFFKCPRVYLNCRDPSEVEAIMSWCKLQGYGDGLVYVSTVEQAEALEEGPGAIVSCVPNFPPVTEAEKTARQVTEAMLKRAHKGALLEMCYHPTFFTEIGALAETAGWQVILGTEAVIYQGLEQDRYWTGKQLAKLPVQKVKDVIANELSKARL